jgi:hypothetical protein
MTTRTKVEDIKNGLKNEVVCKPIFEKHFKEKLTKHPNPYWAMDFFNEPKTFWLEVKERNVNHDQYPTAIISKHKVDFCNENKTATHYFAWKYLDGIYYIKYDSEVWKSIECREYSRFDRLDDRQLPKLHYFIPHQMLEKLDLSVERTLKTD